MFGSFSSMCFKRVVYLLVVSFCLLFANQAKAQNVFMAWGGLGFGVFTSTDRLGVKLGVAYSGNEQGLGTNAALNIAIQEEWYLGDLMSLVANYGVMEKSFQYDLLTADMQEAKQLNTTLKYLYIDYLLKFRKDCNNWCPNVFVGPRLDIVFGQDSDFDKELGGSTEAESSTVGLTYGFGLERPVGSFVFGFSVSHYYDFSSSFDARLEGVFPTIEEDFKQNVIVLDFMISYEFF